MNIIVQYMLDVFIHIKNDDQFVSQSSGNVFITSVVLFSSYQEPHKLALFLFSTVKHEQAPFTRRPQQAIVCQPNDGTAAPATRQLLHISHG